MPTIVLDLDGCLSDFDGAACKRFGVTHRELYSLEMRWPDRVGEIDRFTKNPLTYLFLKPIEGGRIAVDAMRSGGYRAVIVTARWNGTSVWHQRAMKAITLLWLFFNGIRVDEVYVTSSAIKPHLVKALKPYLVIDDSPLQLLEMKHMGLNVAKFEQPWNKLYDFGMVVRGWGGICIGEIEYDI